MRRRNTSGGSSRISFPELWTTRLFDTMLYSALYLSIGFDLQDFIHAPSYEKVELCRKDDLLSIEAHFHIPVKKKNYEYYLRKIS